MLRKEWGFRGLVVTDWGATNDRVKSIPAGLDLEMPASGGVNDRQVLAAVKSGELSESDLDLVIQRNIELILKGAGVRQREIELNLGLHHSLAKRAAGESMVLLKNKDRQLPLKPSLKIAVIGDFAKTLGTRARVALKWCRPRWTMPLSVSLLNWTSRVA